MGLADRKDVGRAVQDLARSREEKPQSLQQQVAKAIKQMIARQRPERDEGPRR
jgi:hypothetical protein